MLIDEPRSETSCDGRLDDGVLAAERRAVLDASLTRLTDRQRDLMTLLLDEPDLS